MIKANPRQKIGKFGVKYHGKLAKIFHSTVEVKLDKDDQTKTFYLNKGSLILWLNSQLDEDSQINKKDKSFDFITSLNHLLETLDKSQAEKEENADSAEPKTYVPYENKRTLKKIGNFTQGFLWAKVYSTSVKSWTTFKLRFALGTKETKRAKISQILAVRAYKQAKRDVPAYQEYMATAEEESGKNPHQFHEIKTTSKDSYIKPYLENEEETKLYNHGRIPLKAKRDTSTGTSGKSTPWYRGEAEQRHVERLTAYAAKVILKNQNYTFINGFAVGPWATGITATLATNKDPKASLCVIGPNIKEMYECIKEQVRLKPGTPIIVGGYPPHIRAVVDLAKKEGFPLHEHTIIGVVGGESMSEDLRDLIVCQKDDEGNTMLDDEGKAVRTGFQQCYSSYGASDLDINIGYESDFEIELRKLCHDPKNKALAEELFGKNEFKPMIFHYDPLNYHIETDEAQNLIFTCVRGDRISPRIRYNLGDRGKAMACSELLATLKKHDIEMRNKPGTNLPLIFVWGRQGAQITFRGCKVAPENLGEAIRRIDAEDSGFNEKIAHYGFYQHDVNGKTKTEILLEFHDDDVADGIDEECLKTLIDKLAEVNSDFVEQIKHCPKKEKPVLRVFKKGDSPMSIQQTKYPMRKKQYIFKEKDEFVRKHKKLKGDVIKLSS